MADITLSPSASNKVKTREAARKIKHGSPKLQEVLRERCRQRMKEKRSQLFNSRRLNLDNSTEHVQETLLEIVRSELSVLATSDLVDNEDFFPEPDYPLNPDEELELENKIMAEEGLWILEEYERLIYSEEKMLASFAEDLEGKVGCPVCVKGVLTNIHTNIVCNLCQLTFPATVTLKDLEQAISECAMSHSINCSAIPSFEFLQDDNGRSLYLTCHTCSTLLVTI
ncbi:uncharacterized protein LOC105701638 [Orussus abietinus]|uniref:uncharacterized protein LOC105701638 n=1 Tax=Orussus abietinus TaxID=222816 RepID=UPI000625CC40|nr:uncharacterized protein LOC105701638 [Orussus abietinus]